MSTTANTTHATTVEPTPTNDKLARLSVEAGKYLDLQAGQRLPIEELYAQGKANGYTDSEIDDLLERDAISSAEAVSVPEQDDLLGDLWSHDPSPTLDPFDLLEPYLIGTRAPHPSTHTFRRWLEGKCEKRRREYDDGTFQHPVEHAYSYKSERANFGRAKDVGRHFVKEHSRFTTVLITYTKPKGDETIAEHAASFYPEKLTACRRRCLERAGASDGYAGVSLLAPKEGPSSSDVAPNPTTHSHDSILLPGFAPSEAFDPLRRRDSVHVSIQYQLSEKVSTPSAINRQDLDRERGPTTALAQEVGANLPVLTAIDSYRENVAEGSCENKWALEAALDASDCPRYVERWCAHMRLGEDGDIGTPGVRRWRPLGRFNEIADAMKEGRDEYKDDNPNPSGETDPGAQAPDLNQKEREFVAEYVAEVGDPDPDVITYHLDRNLGEFGGGGANAEGIVQGVHAEIG